VATPAVLDRHSVRTIGLPDAIDLAFDKIELVKDGRDEPLFSAAALPQLTEPARLDPTRVDLKPESEPVKRSAWRGSIGSLLFHLLPLLALVSWLRPPLEIPKPIPVQLVIEQPPPPPPPVPAKEPPPTSVPPGLRASDDFGEVGKPSAQKGSDPAPPTAGAAPPPPVEAQPSQTPPSPAEAKTEKTPQATAEAQTAKTPPADLPAEASAEAPQVAQAMAPPSPPKPAPPKQQTAAQRVPKLEGMELPLPLNPDHPNQASASARYPGPNASRDEYCAYALNLTTQHINLLPLSQLGARHADTTVMIRVREDGTIIEARVWASSGYSDVDEKVVEMVKAVKQFPPFPLWLRGPTADFTLHMHFPNRLQQ
jgi:TonB family protein